MVWRALVRNWVRQAASQAVYEQMSAAGAAAAAGAAHETPQQPGRLHCDVGIVFAMGTEEGGLEDLLAEGLVLRGAGFRVQRGLLDGRRVALVRSGMGRDAARRATQALIAGHRPSWVISSGFAGGLSPAVRRQEIVIATSIADLEGRRLAIDLKFPDDARPAGGWHAGRLLTVDRIIRLPQEKAALGRAHEALAVDMESLAVADVCREEKVPFLAIRIITDAVEDELPPYLESYATQKTTAAQIGVAVGALLKRPANVKSMLALREESLVASDRLARFLVGVVRRLVPAPTDEQPSREEP